MRKLSLATCLSACALTASAVIACPLTDGVHADTGCMAEALRNTVEAHGLLKIPTTVDEMRQTLYGHPEFQKEYSARLQACLARTRHREGPLVETALQIEEWASEVVDVIHCGKGSRPDPKTSKLATVDLYCPANTECRPVGNESVGRTCQCVARNHHVCPGSAPIACPNGWECMEGPWCNKATQAKS